ncbi:hypothetical protein ILUMI_05367 [Ignelater luminosus]|uniref:Protein takeout n=1 Tax=Ignelater luminosus TaxID=2038154 RepID=A0A8K0DCP6_IGNLU|nr:hypothetical protein ILUMI_05367 [Ignelater luminosus]
MNRTVLFLFAALVLNVCKAGKLPPEYQKCKRDDPNFTKCLESAIQDAWGRLENGIPSLKVPSLHPFNVPSLTVGEGKGAVNLKQHYTNYDLYGFSKGNIEKFNAKLTPTDLKLEFEIKYPELRAEADYKFDGQILALPIVGDGKCVIKMLNPFVKAEIEFETFERKGEKYLKVKKIKLKIVPEKMVAKFENLFNGNAELGDTMNRLINENWQVLFEDIEGPITESTEVVLADYTDRFLSKVPYDELF